MDSSVQLGLSSGAIRLWIKSGDGIHVWTQHWLF